MGILTSTFILASGIIVSFGVVEFLLTPDSLINSYEAAVGPMHKMINQLLC